MKRLFLRKGDEVLIQAGKDRGRKGKVIEVRPKEDRVFVEGIQIAKRHVRPTQKVPQGGIVEAPASVHISTCMVICPRCKKPTRVRREVVNGRLERRCKKCSESLSG